jgi:hypothetical protein
VALAAAVVAALVIGGLALTGAHSSSSGPLAYRGFVTLDRMPVDPNHAFTFGQMVIINRGGTPATLKAAAGMTEENVDGRLAVAHSDFRVMSLWGVVPPGGGGSIEPSGKPRKQDRLPMPAPG